MCKFCPTRADDLLILDRQTSDTCQHPLEDIEEICAMPAQFALQSRHVYEHLCKIHMRNVVVDMLEGRLTLHQLNGYSTGELIKEIEPKQTCEYMWWCPRLADYAQITTGIMYLCYLHKDSEDIRCPGSNPETKCLPY